MARKENAFIISLCVIFVLEDTQQLVHDIFFSESEWHQVISNIAHSLWDPTRANTVIMLCCSSLMTHTIFILSKRYECQPKRFLSSHAQLIISIQILVLHQTIYINAQIECLRRCISIKLVLRILRIKRFEDGRALIFNCFGQEQKVKVNQCFFSYSFS